MKMPPETLTALLGGEHLSMEVRAARGLLPLEVLRYAEVRDHLASVTSSSDYFPRRRRAALSGYTLGQRGKRALKRRGGSLLRRTWIASISLAALFVVSGCAQDRVVTAPQPSAVPPSATSTETSEGSAPSASIAWLDTPLTDAVTGKEFRLSDYKGKPILLHAFATW